jgi:AraC-like DNA-binding protein
MTSGADDFRPHRFSTDDLLERDRVAIWREVFGRRMYFNRAFRRRYGASPSDVRAAATGGT